MSRIIIFVGETHTSLWDKERTREIAGYCTEGGRENKFIVVAEREIFGKAGQDPSAILAQRSNVVNEVSIASSGDNQRNIDIVALALNEMEKDIGGGLFSTPRPVIILFGQDHEAKIKLQFQLQVPQAEILWWSFPSMQEQFENVADISDSNTAGFDFIGFFNPVTFSRLQAATDDVMVKMTLWMKGHYHGSFTVPVTPYYNTNFDVALRAVYARQGVGRFAAIINHLEMRGTLNVLIDQDVKLIKVRDRAHWEQLSSGA